MKNPSLQSFAASIYLGKAPAIIIDEFSCDGPALSGVLRSVFLNLKSVCLCGENVLRYQQLNYLSVLVCACGLLIGCGGGDGPTLAPASGVVNYKGKPIGKINVMLTPSGGGKGMIAEGTSDESGKFKLQTKEPDDGAMVGSYAVAFKYVPEVSPIMPGFDGVEKIVSPIPEKYGDASQSGHTATVDADKSKNNFTFDLK